MAERSSGSYVYLPIADAKKAVNMRVNFFAKILEFGLPKKSNGTDYYRVLKIVDQSCPPPGISVTFFAEDEKKLPNVRSAGDIISLHHVEMKIHNGAVNCIFGKKFSSFALFNGKTNMAVNPYQTSPKYSVADDVEELLPQLRKFSLEHPSDAGLIKSLPLLMNIKTDKPFNLICKVFHVCETSKDAWVIFVWDGTDLPPVTFETKIYDGRRESKLERMPFASFPEPSYITETDQKSVTTYATLMDSITHPEVVHKVKCIVRVAASCPWRGEDLRSPLDGNYRIRLTLEDPTARVHAYIIGEEGVKFFGGNPPAHELTEKMCKLLGITEPASSEASSTSRNPPWIWCSLMSYYLDKSNPLGSRRYRIFGTCLVD